MKLPVKVTNLLFGGLTLLIILFGSCKSLEPLVEGENYLKTNKIKLIVDERPKDRESIIAQSTKLIRQMPLEFKLFNISTWRRSAIVHNQNQTEESIVSIQNYLRNKKGFYNAEVHVKPKVYDRYVINTYILKLNKRFTLNNLEVVSKDTALLHEVNKNWDETLLHKDIAIEESIFSREKERISNHLKDAGYWKFSTNFIQVEGDSSNNQVDVRLIIDQIQNEDHKKYYVNDVNVYTEHSFVENPTFSHLLRFNNKFYYRRGENFVIKPKSLDRNIYYQKGELLTRTDRLLTLRALQRLPSLQFIYPEEKISIVNDSLVDVSIFLSPKEKLWTADLGVNLFYSVLAGSTNDDINPSQNFLGIGASSTLTNRNMFKGGEQFSINVDGTLELDIDSLSLDIPSNNIARTTAYTIGNQLDLPRFRELFPILKSVKNLNVASSILYKNMRNQATTQVDANYNYTNIRNAFSSKSLNASWGYQYKPDVGRLLQYKQTGINIFTTAIDSVYQANVLDPSPARAANFDPNVSVGILFREISYYNTGKTGTKFWSHNFIASADFSGLEILLANGIRNAISANDKTWKLGQYDFAKYLKFECNNRFYKHFDEKHKLVFRADLGVILDLGNGIPFYTQFLSGGPNSIRAWQLRQLGPDLNQLMNPAPDIPFFQSGNMKIELSTEYRFKLISFLEGAAFIDAGNLYSINNDDPNYNNVGFDFYKTLAVGLGYGLRMDFEYFIIRFDFGYKMVNPFKTENGKRFILFNSNFNNYLGNVNVAINYPF